MIKILSIKKNDKELREVVRKVRQVHHQDHQDHHLLHLHHRHPPPHHHPLLHQKIIQIQINKKNDLG